MTAITKAHAESIEVNDLNDFVKILSGWHQERVKVLQHLMTIPDTGVQIELEGQDTPLVGEYRKGFIFGLNVALGELGKLPFVAEMETPSDTQAHDQTQS
jgi:hypothetical protein